MRIAQVSSLMEAVPPKLYGGTERIVSFLTEELVQMGHDVTLFASGDSVTSATLEPCWPQAMRLDDTAQDYLAPHMIMVERIARRATDFDIIHLHIDYLGYPVLDRIGVPFVTTLHGRLDLPVLPPLYAMFSDVPVVSISDWRQREPLPNANYIGTIHHGLPQNLLKQGDGSGGYLAFIGRISPEKAPDAAIRIAGGGGHEAQDRGQDRQCRPGLFREQIKHLIDLPHVE